MTTRLLQCSAAIAFFSLMLAPDPVAAQDRPGWQREFDEVTVKNIRPEDLPTAEESLLPDQLSAQSVLPRPASLETLRKTSARVSDLVVEVIVVEEQGDSTLRRTPVVLRGEAIWVSVKPNGEEPVLVTNAHWLRQATAIMLRPTERRQTGALPTVQRRSLSDAALGSDAKSVLADSSLVPLEVTLADKHRNLAVLGGEKLAALAPKHGLQLFDIENRTPSAIYGFSHKMGSALVQARFLAPKDKSSELLFYLQTTYPVILGAPLLSDDGRVVSLTAMRHPKRSERTLAIPPRALRTFLEKAQAPATDEGAPGE